jgi:squalene synthase HpnC
VDRDALRLAREHYENFPVISRLLPPELREPFAAVYAFARVTDDLGDEIAASPAARLAALEAWEAGFEAALAGRDGGAARDPVLAGAVRAIRAHDLPPEAFRTLVRANRLDQVRTRYASWADLLEYCELSANPVGRVVLRLLGSRDDAHHAASDAVCTALQLANHWQGIGEDLRYRARLYVPLEELQRFGVCEKDLLRDRPSARALGLVRSLVERTRAVLRRGERLPEAFEPRRAAVLRLFAHGCRAILDEVERRPEDLLRGKVRVPPARMALLVALEELRVRAALLTRRVRRGSRP